jgi:hypothetical protein
MRHLKHHAMHLLMCAPMLVIALVAIASGASLASLAPVVMCMLMMGLMMSGMHNHGGGRGSR